MKSTECSLPNDTCKMPVPQKQFHKPYLTILYYDVQCIGITHFCLIMMRSKLYFCATYALEGEFFSYCTVTVQKLAV